MNEENSKNKIILIIICIIVIICVLFFIYFKFIKTDNKRDNNSLNYTNVEVLEKDILSDADTNTDSDTYNETYDFDTDDEDDENDENGTFLFPIEDVFTVSGKGTVVSGKIERGTIKINDTVQIIGIRDEIKTTAITGIEMYKEDVDKAKAGDYVKICLKDIDRDGVERGQVLAEPNSIKSKAKFDAQIYTLKEEDDDVLETSLYDGYERKFFFRTTDVEGKISLPSGTEMVKPGEKANITVALDSPVAMEIGTKFSIRKGGRTIGEGKVTKIY